MGLLKKTKLNIVKIMEAIEFVNLVAKEHGRTSCYDDNINNGFSFEDDDETISLKYLPRCKRCAYLQIANGTIKLTETNIKLLEERYTY